MKQIVSVVVVFVVLIMAVLIAQHPYFAYATTTTCPAPPTSQVTATISVDGPTTLTAGAKYSITVGENAAVSTYSNYSLGFVVNVLPSATNQLNGSVEVARVYAQQTGMLTPATHGSVIISWVAPTTLLPGTYQFAPLVMAGGGNLQLAEVDPVTRTATSTTLPTVYLDGTTPFRVNAANGNAPLTGSTEQELVQYFMQNSTATDQSSVLRVRVWTGEPGSLPISRSDTTYSQTIAPGRVLSRQFFIDTDLFGSGTVEAELTSGSVVTTQWFTINGTLTPGIVVSTINQTGHKVADMGISHTAICLAASSNIAADATIHLTLSDATQKVILDKTLQNSDLKSGEYMLNEYALEMHWPVTVEASVSVNGSEVSRYTNTYQP